jgi:hypothetical protein
MGCGKAQDIVTVRKASGEGPPASQVAPLPGYHDGECRARGPGKVRGPFGDMSVLCPPGAARLLSGEAQGR